MTQITGKATVRVDGEELLTEVGATLNVGGVEREAQLGPRGVQGYKENPVAPTLQVTVQHTGETDMVRLAAITAGTVLFETDTGVTYLLRSAFVTEPPAIDTSAGTFGLSFSCMGLERV